MKIGIIGSRTFDEYELLKICILKMFQPSDIEYIVSGGANGADRLGEKFAKEFNIPTKIFIADWSKGKSAGFQRNVNIIKNSNFIFAFWDGESKGTNHSISLCHKYKKPYMVLFFKNKVEETNLEDFLK